MLWACGSLCAQPAVLATQGGYVETEGGLFQWTFGEVFVTKFEASRDYSVHEGFQQGTYASEGLNPRESLSGSLSVIEGVRYYPNPVVKYLTIEDMDRVIERILVFDSSGNEVQSLGRETDKQVLRINMDTQPGGVYFVRLYDGNGALIKRFRVVRRGF